MRSVLFGVVFVKLVLFPPTPTAHTVHAPGTLIFCLHPENTWQQLPIQRVRTRKPISLHVVAKFSNRPHSEIKVLSWWSLLWLWTLGVACGSTLEHRREEYCFQISIYGNESICFLLHLQLFPFMESELRGIPTHIFCGCAFAFLFIFMKRK